MVNVSLVQAILREQDDPGCSTTRLIRDLYNTRSGEDPVLQHTDEDKEFQSILLKALEEHPVADDDDDEDKPISYTVKLKDSDDNSTPTVKRRSIIKLPKEASESEESSSDSEKPSAAPTTTMTQPFSPLFLNNMKKYGVSTDWLAKRSNSLRQTSYSRSSVKSNTSKLDAMIKSASAKPIRSNRKLSFIENPETKPGTDKENTSPSEETTEKKETEKPKPTPYDLSSEAEEDKDDDAAGDGDDDDLSPSKVFSLRIPRVDLPGEENKRLNTSSSSSISNDELKKVVKTKPKQKRRSKKEKPSEEPTEKTQDEQTKKPSQKKDKNELEQSRIEHLKKLLRLSGIKLMIKKTELDEYQTNKAKINYLKSIFDNAGYTGNLSIKDCEKYRKKRDTEKELLEIQSTSTKVKGHVKGGRTLRGQGRNSDESNINTKRKRTASSEIEEDDDDDKNNEKDKTKNNNSISSDDDKPIIKKRRVLQMEASPEVSENES